MEPLPVPSSSSTRLQTVVLPHEQEPFKIIRKKDQYKHQFAHLYYTRLQLMRPAVLASAKRKWDHLPSKPTHVSRVLEVTKARLCYIIGTVYMDMPLKPSIIDELARDSNLMAPEIKDKIYSPDDKVALEDESGRIRLVGSPLKKAMLVTGIIVGALGAETANGDFEVIDLCYAGMAAQQQTGEEDSEMDIDGGADDEWVAAVSGLEVGARSPTDGPIQMLADYLVGEGGAAEDQFSSSLISRLFILGDSIATIVEAVNADGFAHGTNAVEKKLRQGQETTTFSQMPLRNFTAQLFDIAKALPVHLLPGATDPAGGSLPQQAFPRGMFGNVSQIPSFSSETNPSYINIETTGRRKPIQRTLLLNSGQPLNDMAKYLPSPPMTRLALLESTLKWRHIAPTAPDTLWCFPYVSEDPFIIDETPDFYLAGGQPQFGTKLVVDNKKENEKARCRIVLVPSFSKTGILVLLNVRTLEVKTITFQVSDDLLAGVQNDEFDKVDRLPTPEPMAENEEDEEVEKSTAKKSKGKSKA